MKISKRVILCSLAAILSLVVILPFVLYLNVLPQVVSSDKTSEYIQNFVKDNFGADLTLIDPELETGINPEISFKVKEIKLAKDKKNLIIIRNLDTTVSLEKVLAKTVTLKKIILDDFYADVNEILILVNKDKKEEEPKPIDWNIEWLNSQLLIKKAHFDYLLPNKTKICFTGKNMEIESAREPKHVHFDIVTNISNDIENLEIKLKAGENVYIKNHKLYIDSNVLSINNSNVFIKAEADQQNNFSASVYSHNFKVKNAVELLESNIIIPNGKEMLSYYKDYKGNFSFNIDVNNKGINGIIKINNAGLKIISLSNLPIMLEKGTVKIDTKQITFEDFSGYYGTKRKNSQISMVGTIKDYTNSVDMDLEASGNVTNEFTEKYLSPLIGCKVTLTAPAKSKVFVKSKYGKIDLRAMSRVVKGEDILFEGASLSPVGYDRAIVSDFHLDKNMLDIKSIRYYIADAITKETKNIKPILTLDGIVDIATMEIHKLGFDIPNPLPSEFLNVLIGQKVFQKGTISGQMYMVNDNKIQRLKGALEMDKVRIPSQRMSIKKAKLTTDRNLIHATANGRFKRSQYDFSGSFKNEVLLPIVVKDLHLKIDNIDIEKLMKSMNNQNTDAVTALDMNKTTIHDDETNEHDDLYTFDTGLLIVEKCALEIIKGVYKDIKFGNIIADLTLNKYGILEVKSNRFDFAEGISSLKVFCDLKNHKYFIKLGVKDINSDLIAGSLLNLQKEISGKAKGLIELNTDDSFRLNGKIIFDIKNGSIQKVGLVEYALKFASLFRNPIKMISPSTIVDLVNVPDGKFETINGELKLKDNVIEKIMIKSKAPLLSSFIVGRYDLDTSDATLRIYTKFSSKTKGALGFMRNISLNSLANKIPLSSSNDSLYYSAELSLIPPIDAKEEDCQVFLTKIDGDVEKFNFLSSLKKIK